MDMATAMAMAMTVAMTMAMATAVQSCGDKVGQHGPKMAEPGVIKSANCKDKIGAWMRVELCA